MLKICLCVTNVMIQMMIQSIKRMKSLQMCLSWKVAQEIKMMMALMKKNVGWLQIEFLG